MSSAYESDVAAADDAVPWLSILIPVYNVQGYLEECVESVICQAGNDVEVLLLDDRSTDGSFELMKSLAQRWPGRLTLMQHAVNSGPGAARNAMIDVARGEYLWFLDSDDKLTSAAVEELRNTIAVHAPDVVLCDFSVWRKNPKFKHWLRGEHHKRTFAGKPLRLMRECASVLTGLLRTGQLHPWSKISRRSLWTPHIRFPEGKYFEDMLPTLLMVSEASSFFYQPRPWVAYRQRENSILNDMNLQKVRDQSAALLPLRSALAGKSWADDPELRFMWAHQCARNLTGAMRYVSRQEMVFQEADLLASKFRADFEAASPLSARELRKEYLRRRWYGNYLKFHRWFGYTQK